MKKRRTESASHSRGRAAGLSRGDARAPCRGLPSPFLAPLLPLVFEHGDQGGRRRVGRLGGRSFHVFALCGRALSARALSPFDDPRQITAREEEGEEALRFKYE